jgi:hypothetical protein
MKRKLLWTALIMLVLPAVGALFYGAIKAAWYGDLTGILFLGTVLFASVVSGLAVALLNLPKNNADRRKNKKGNKNRMKRKFAWIALGIFVGVPFVFVIFKAVEVARWNDWTGVQFIGTAIWCIAAYTIVSYLLNQKDGKTS